MGRHHLAIAACLVLASCGSKGDPAPPALAIDAGSGPAAPAAAHGVTELPAYDPDAGMHLDRDEREPPVTPVARPRGRGGRVLGIILRSVPSGALAAVDGQPVGPTPAYWEGEFTGGEREFTFTLAGYAVARYRFVPITGGVVYGHLEPIAVGEPAVVAPLPRPAPAPAPAPALSAPPLPAAPDAPPPPPPPIDAAPLDGAPSSGVRDAGPTP
jgi:hypothetical protein